MAAAVRPIAMSRSHCKENARSGSIRSSFVSPSVGELGIYFHPTPGRVPLSWAGRPKSLGNEGLSCASSGIDLRSEEASRMQAQARCTGSVPQASVTYYENAARCPSTITRRMLSTYSVGPNRAESTTCPMARARSTSAFLRLFFVGQGEKESNQLLDFCRIEYVADVVLTPLGATGQRIIQGSRAAIVEVGCRVVNAAQRRRIEDRANTFFVGRRTHVVAEIIRIARGRMTGSTANRRISR